MNQSQDQAPGIPIDCALSRYIRAHIITRQLEESMSRVSSDKGCPSDARRAAETQGAIDRWAPERSTLHVLLSDDPADCVPALLRRQAE
jgi:hypothetical protein